MVWCAPVYGIIYFPQARVPPTVLILGLPACKYSLRQSCVAVLRLDFEEWERLIGRPFGSRFWGLRLKRPFLIDQQRFDGIRVVVCKGAFFISPLRVLALPLLVMATPADNVRIENALVDSEEAQGREKIPRIDSSMDTTGGAASSTGVLQNGGGSEVTDGQGVNPVSALLSGPVGLENQRQCIEDVPSSSQLLDD